MKVSCENRNKLSLKKVVLKIRGIKISYLVMNEYYNGSSLKTAAVGLS